MKISREYNQEEGQSWERVRDIQDAISLTRTSVTWVAPIADQILAESDKTVQYCNNPIDIVIQ